MMKKLSLILVAAMMMCGLSAVYAEERATEATYADIAADAPYASRFWLEEGGNGYILLDGDGETSLILADANYGQAVFNTEGKQIYDTQQSGNIGYYVEHNVSLPEQIEKYLVEYDWKIEAGLEGGGCESEYTVRSKLSLLSGTEFEKYYKKFGYTDNAGGEWWLRSPEGKKSNPTQVLFCSETGAVAAADSTLKKYVRPVFRVSNDFFKNVKLDTDSMGTDVKKRINKLCGDSQLNAIGYSAIQQNTIKSEKPGSSLLVEYIEPEHYLGKISSLDQNTFKLKIKSNGQDASVYKIVYDLDGEEQRSKTVTVTDDAEYSFEIPTKYGSFNLNIKIYKGNLKLYNKTYKVVYMEPYKKQFMDEYNGYGMGTHTNSVPYNPETGTYDNYYNMLDIDYLEATGAKYYREGNMWAQMEWFNQFEYREQLWWGFDEFKKRGIKAIGVVGGSNAGYDPTITNAWAPFYSKYMMDAFARYVLATYKRQEPAAVEVWNEPNIPGFWGGIEPNAADYANIVKRTFIAIRQGDPDTEVLAGAPSSPDVAFITGMYEAGAYPYSTGMSYHPYMTPQMPTENGVNILYTKMMSMEDVLTYYGGWKDVYGTEAGWPTSVGYNTDLEQVQALVQLFVIGDWAGMRANMWYDWLNDGTSTTNREDQFGLVDAYRYPKKSMIAYKNLNETLGGAIFHGNVKLGTNDYSFVYSREGKPVIVSWDPVGETTYDFGKDCVVTDTYGNVIDNNGGKVTIGEMPIYISNLDNSWFEKNFKKNFTSSYNAWLKWYGKNVMDGDTFAKVNARMNEGYNKAMAAKTAGEMKAALDDYTAAGEMMYASVKNGTCAMREMSGALYRLDKVMKFMYNYMEVLPGNDADYAAEAAEAVSASGTDLTDGYTKEYSSEMLRHAKRYVKEAGEISQMEDNPAKQGIVASYNLHALNLCKWYNVFEKAETRSNILFNLRWENKNTGTYDGENKNFEFTGENYTDIDLKAHVELYDESGKLLNKTEDKTVRQGDAETFSVSTLIKKDGAKSTKNLKARIIANGEILTEYNINLTFADIFNISLKPAEETVDKLNELTLNVANTFETENSATIMVSCPYIDFANNSQTVTVGATSTAEAKYPIANIRETDYHYYPITISTYSSSGTLTSQKTILWDFLLTSKAEDGFDVKGTASDVSAWKNAYPIYLDQPSDPTSIDSWKTSQAAGRIMTMYDSGYMYILYDVYDKVWVQNATGDHIWEGDSVQSAIDSLDTNAGELAYLGGDVTEVGASLTVHGTNVYMWSSVNGAGSLPDTMGEVVRNNDDGITRYQYKVRVSDLKSQKAEAGMKMGMNFLINDTDTITRDYWAEYTGGIGQGKDASKFATFTLVDSGEKESVKTSSPFPAALGASSGNDESAGGESDVGDGLNVNFTDIDNHWASREIKTLANAKIAEGVSDTEFNPEGTVTRAEFIAMVLRTAEISPKAYTGGFTDVSAGDWYADTIQAAADAGLIDSHFVQGGAILPNQPITREEMASLINNIDVYKKANVPDYVGALSSFADGGSISDFARAAVSNLLMDGIIRGYEDGTFKPANTATRAEAAAMLYNYITK